MGSGDETKWGLPASHLRLEGEEGEKDKKEEGEGGRKIGEGKRERPQSMSRECCSGLYSLLSTGLILTSW